MFKLGKIKLSKNYILLAIAILGIAVTVILVLSESMVSSDSVVKKSIEYLNKNLLQQGQTATLVSYSKESGVIKIKIDVSGKSYDSYVTKDGKIIFPQGFLTDTSSSDSNQPTNQGPDINNVNTENDPFIGKADAAVVMAYWFDYQCPFCKKTEQEIVSKLISEYVNSGKLKIVFKDYAFLGSDSTTAGLAANAVWEIAPNKFFEWHKAMFEKQDNENGGWGSKADILALTQSLGIDSSKIGQLMASKEAEYQKEMDSDKAEGTSFGINGTPGSIIGKQLISGAQPYETFKASVDAVLGGK